jgi:hypothetical protein
LNRRLGEPQIGLDALKKIKQMLHFLGMEPRFLGYAACSLFTVAIELHPLLLVFADWQLSKIYLFISGTKISLRVTFANRNKWRENTAYQHGCLNNGNTPIRMFSTHALLFVWL